MNNKHNIKGKLTYFNEIIYEGEYLNDKGHGYGVYYNRKTQAKYEGYFKNGWEDGKGIKVYPNGASYKGNFKKGRKRGYGLEIYPNIGSYEGYFKNGKRFGFGIEKWLDGTIYEGQFYDDKWHGKGL
jgi:hypothetical protein